MDNKEFEKKLEQIKTFKEVPVSVDEKIQKAFEKIEENEKIEKEVKKQKSKFNFSRVLTLAASFVMAIFLAGNGVAYAKGEPNIYSWVLEKIGIQKEYEEIKTEINQIVEVDAIQEDFEGIKKYKVKMALKDIGYDNNLLIAGWTIESPQLMEIFTQYEGQEIEEIKSGIEDLLELDLNININNENVIYNYSLPEGVEEEFINSYRITKCLSNNEILVYEIFILDELEVDEIRNIEINISRIIEAYSDGAWEVVSGNWSFAVKDIEKNTNFIKEYASLFSVEYIVDKEYVEEYNVDGSIQKRSNQMNVTTDGEKGRIEINKIINCKSASLMYITSNLEIDTTVEPKYCYCFEITDANGNIILEKTLLYFLENKPVITQEKLKEGETYNINIYKIIDSDIYYIQPRISNVGNGEFIKIHSQEVKLGK